MSIINFGNSSKYDDGVAPSVAMNNQGVVVEVHKSQDHDTLWYRVGQRNGQSVTWGSSHQYDTGVAPSVALTDSGLVVEVHKSQNHDTLWYHVGQVSGSSIAFGPSQKYDDGVAPSVAINNRGVVVEVHKSQNFDTLWYHVGQVSGSSVNFSGSHQYDDGVAPSIALNDNGLVVEVHKSQSHDTLWYHTGQVSGNSINFGGSHQYDDGVAPSVAINNRGDVVEAHKSQNHDTLWYHAGQVSGAGLNFGDSHQYDDGVAPRIAIDNARNVVEVHQSQNHPTLWYHAGALLDLRGWMQQNPALHTRKLRNICLPATHDTGTYALQDTLTSDPSPLLATVLNKLKSVADTINAVPGIGKVLPNPPEWVTSQAIPAIKALSTATRRTVAQQLDEGIRCLDLRVNYNASDKQYYTAHGLLGSKITDILADIKNFVASTQGEIVYVTMGHFSNFGTAQYGDFANTVKGYLKDYAFANNGSKNLFDYTYNEIIDPNNAKSRVILVTNAATDPIFWPGGSSGYSPPDNGKNNTNIFGYYTDTTDLSQMLQAQQSQMQTAITQGAPFALYLTLTPQTNDAIERVVFSLKSAIAKLGLTALAIPFVGLELSPALEAVAAGLAIGDATLPWQSLEDLSQTINKTLTATVQNSFVTPHPGENRISLLYLDYYENTNVVALAIRLSTM